MGTFKKDLSFDYRSRTGRKVKRIGTIIAILVFLAAVVIAVIKANL